MEGTLLSVETPILEIIVDNDTLRVTNKRLIHNEKFIGIHELRGANVTVTSVTVGDGKVQGYDVTKAWSAIILTIVFFICCYITMHPYNLPTYGGYFLLSLFGGILFASWLAAPLHLMLKAKDAVAGKTMEMAWLVVEKTDNTYFINKYYGLSQIEQLKKLESEVNTLIFK